MLADVPNPDPEGAAPKTQPAADAERAPSAKRKDPPPPTGTRFKAAANMVMAMRRFQAALNPTYTYGKRAASGTATSAETGPSAAAATGATPPADTAASRTPPPSGGLFDHHGHKASLLARPLPPTPAEAGAGAAK